MEKKILPGFVQVDIANSRTTELHPAYIAVRDIRAIIHDIDEKHVKIDLGSDSGFVTAEPFEQVVDKLYAALTEF